MHKIFQEIRSSTINLKPFKCAKEHLQALGEYKGKRGVQQSRKHMTWYAKGFVGANELRNKLSLIESVQEGLQLLDGAIEMLG